MGGGKRKKERDPYFSFLQNCDSKEKIREREREREKITTTVWV